MECKHLLSPESCALCNGSSARYDQELRSEVSELMKGDDLDRSFALEALRAHQLANDFSALPPDRSDQDMVNENLLIQAEHRRVRSTGKWNKTHEVLGGDDSQVEFEDVEPSD